MKIAISLLYDMDVLLCAHVSESLWPNRDTDLTKVCRSKKVHVGPGLSNTATNAQWNLIIENGLVVWEIEKILLTGHLELYFE